MATKKKAKGKPAKAAPAKTAPKKAAPAKKATAAKAKQDAVKLSPGQRDALALIQVGKTDLEEHDGRVLRFLGLKKLVKVGKKTVELTAAGKKLAVTTSSEPTAKAA